MIVPQISPPLVEPLKACVILYMAVRYPQLSFPINVKAYRVKSCTPKGIFKETLGEKGRRARNRMCQLPSLTR